MKRTWPILTLLVLLTLAGAVINANLAAKHTAKGVTPPWFQEICAPEDDPTYNCDAVLETKWAVFSFHEMSFSEPDPQTGAQEGPPVALLGWYYFSALAVWFLAVGRPSFHRRWLHLLLTLTVVAGVCVSVFFSYVLFYRMEIKCTWCLIAHGINVLVLVGVLLLWPRKPAPAVADLRATSGEGKPGSPTAAPAFCACCGGPADSESAGSPPAHPRWRLLLVTGALALAAIYAEYLLAVKSKYQYEAAVYKTVSEQVRRELEEIHNDALTQMAQFQAAEAVKIDIRPDDPMIGDKDEIMIKLVLFSDFQCPSCGKLAEGLEERINPDFDHLLRIIWKHLPWSTDCNPYAGRDMHPRACEAARAAEAARLQGGNEVFWKAHDLLFASRKKLSTLDYRKFAEELGLDSDRFLQDMDSDAVKDRITEDIEQARKLGLKATPSIFLGGKKIRTYTLYNKQFMDEVKKSALKARKAKLSAQARREAKRSAAPKPTATPDTPNP